jgi:coenzyme F420 biosynthesis associated uncharacterized protein
VDATTVDWSMGAQAARLVDWATAGDVGRRVAGRGAPVPSVQRARMREDFADLVPRSEELIRAFTGLSPNGFRSRAWVMSRADWVRQNLKGMQRLLEPLAERMMGEHPNRGEIRRVALGAQFGVLIGYVGRRVLGQYDVFLPPDDDGLLYFVGPNVAETEHRFGLPASDFRLWIALHEVTHRVQFSAAPWLRQHMSSMIDGYLNTIELDPKQVLEQLRQAAQQARTGGARGLDLILLLLTPEQRDLFHRMQAMMSVLEGHASFVMNEVAVGRVGDLGKLRRSLVARRQAHGLERGFQKAIGLETKMRQYDAGERFVREVVARAGMDGLNKVWAEAAALPSTQEIAEPLHWVERVAGG